jgi:hypothetical protein
VPSDTPPYPTSEQCTANAPLKWGNGRRGFATWRYPQMGGYGARSVVEFLATTVAPKEGLANAPGIPDFCFDVWIWHDGEFPFDPDDVDNRGRRPTCLHHCNAEQFITFGQLVEAKGEEFLIAEAAKKGGSR